MVLSRWRLNSVGLKLMAVCITVFLFSGCSSTPKSPSDSTVIKPLNKSINLANQSLVQKRLKQQYRVWAGTPYKYGGTTRKGVDCSAFVQNTYRNAFGYAIPRTTRTQIKKGVQVDKADLQAGDVVFFKTGKNSLHNGVYLGNRQFVHASSSRGVVISRLDNVYWKRTYYTARRMH